MDRPLEEELTLEMIPEGPYRSIAEAVGVGSFLIITEMLGGAVTYIPKKESILKPVLNVTIAHVVLCQHFVDLIQNLFW